LKSCSHFPHEFGPFAPAVKAGRVERRIEPLFGMVPTTAECNGVVVRFFLGMTDSRKHLSEQSHDVINGDPCAVSRLLVLMALPVPKYMWMLG